MSRQHTTTTDYSYDQLHINPVNRFLQSERVTAESLLCTGREPHLDLAGPWHYSIDVFDNGLRAHWYDKRGGEFEPGGPVDYSFEDWPTVDLPSCWNLQRPELRYYEGSVWFYRKLGTIVRSEEERVFLHFGAVNYYAIVFVNHRLAGVHEGGFTPFSIDITEHLRDDNIVHIWVNNTRRANGVPAEFMDWMNYGGIYRDLGIYVTPEVHIVDYSLSLERREEGHAIRFAVEMSHSGRRSVRLSLNGLHSGEYTTDDRGRLNVLISARPRLWSPEEPVLYPYEVSCGDDVVRGRTGFRIIETRGNRVLLNGEEIYLKGVSTHEESLMGGRTVSEAEYRETILRAKELGCNFLRLAHYPHGQTMARLADEMGMLLWEEIPVYWALNFTDPGVLENAKNQLAELIRRDRNSPSVAFWCVGNENPDSDERFKFMKALVAHAHRLDATRLVTAACLVNLNTLRVDDRLATELDLVGINEYFGWYYGDYQKLEELVARAPEDKPIIISEFGADAVAENHGDTDERWTEEYQAGVYDSQLSVFRATDRLAGICPWLLYDFPSPRRLNQHQRGYNLKGLLDRSKRVRKRAFTVLQKFYTER
ncbi:glycoside hydrolase family 2 protein [Salinispira pacifica]